MVILRSASASTTKGGEDTFDPSNVESKRDSTCYSAEGSESDTSSDSGTSEDQRSNEDGGSTSTVQLKSQATTTFDFPFEFPDEKGSKADTNRASEQLRTEIRMASLPVRNEVFRLRSENKDLRGQICDTRTEPNEVKKFSCF